MLKVRITRANGWARNRFSRFRRGSLNHDGRLDGVQNSMIGIGIGDHMARL